MEESRWYNSAEEYRTVQGMFRMGRYREALERANAALVAGYLGRRHAARLHTLICRLYTEELHRTCPAAVLHGEEALRIADLINDAWIKCDALFWLVQAHARMGDVARARAACDEVALELERNEAVIAGRYASLYLLRAAVAMAEGHDDRGLAELQQAETMLGQGAAEVAPRVQVLLLGALLANSQYSEARRRLDEGTPDVGDDTMLLLDWAVYRAWLATVESPRAQARAAVQDVLERADSAGHTAAGAHCLVLSAILTQELDPAEARRLGQLGIHRALAAGRLDLARQFRRRLESLLSLSW